ALPPECAERGYPARLGTSARAQQPSGGVAGRSQDNGGPVHGGSVGLRRSRSGGGSLLTRSGGVERGGRPGPARRRRRRTRPAPTSRRRQDRSLRGATNGCRGAPANGGIAVARQGRREGRRA